MKLAILFQVFLALMNWVAMDSSPPLVSGQAYIPSCTAIFQNTSVGYSTIAIQLRDVNGNPLSDDPQASLRFKLSIYPKTIPDDQAVVQEAAPGGYNLIYYATVASYKLGAGTPSDYSLEGQTTLFTIRITESSSGGKDIRGSPFVNALYISPGS